MFGKYLVLIGALAFAHLTAANGWAKPTAEFVEDRIGQGPWKFEFHGYARLPVLLADGPTGERGPDLVDDNYGQSGFAYLRANETEWVEMTLSAVNGPTRVVAGILANQLSDWSDRQGRTQHRLCIRRAPARDHHKLSSKDPLRDVLASTRLP